MLLKTGNTRSKNPGNTRPVNPCGFTLGCRWLRPPAPSTSQVDTSGSSYSGHRKLYPLMCPFSSTTTNPSHLELTIISVADCRLFTINPDKEATLSCPRRHNCSRPDTVTQILAAHGICIQRNKKHMGRSTSTYG